MLFGMNLEVPRNGRVYITDLYGNRKDIKVVDNMYVECLQSLETDGFTVGVVIMEEYKGLVTYLLCF